MAIWHRRELLKRAVLHYLSLVNNDDAVAFHDSRESMSDDDRGTTYHCLIQRLLHNLLTLLIEGRGSLIQNQDLWVLDKSSSNSYALLLTTREFRSLQSADLLEARMKALLGLSDILTVDEAFKALLVVVFNSAFRLSDEVLELEVINRFLFLALSDEIIHSLEVELALIDL